MEEKNLINIDYELVRELRRTKRTTEANELLRLWRKNVEDNKEQVKREIRNVTTKIYKIKNPKKAKMYRKKYYNKNKEKIVKYQREYRKKKKERSGD